MNSSQEQGRALYKRGDYQKAIECFDRAIDRAHSVQLLDNRAACHEKLNDFPAALKDAKKVIQLHREDATGYLRAGRLLTKMEKHAVALEVYSHGLRCIKHVGQGYEALKKAHKATLDVVAPPKSVDPLTMLPRELAESIMQYLSFRQRVNACLVSRGWNSFIHSAPNLWAHLDLTGARKNVRSAFISRAINTGRSKLREATLTRVYDFDKTVKALVKSCPLENLTLLDCGRQGPEFNDALEKAKHLKSISIKNGDLVSDLDGLIDSHAGGLQSIHIVSVQNLQLVQCEKLTSFSALVKNPSNAIRFLTSAHRTMPHIQHLRIESDPGSASSPTSFDLATCSSLETFECRIMTTSRDTMSLPSTSKILRFGPLYVRHDGGQGIFNNTFKISDGMRLPYLQELALQWGDCDRGMVVQNMLRGFEGGSILHSDVSKTWTQLHTLGISGAELQSTFIEDVLKEPRLRELRALRLPDSHGLTDEKVTEIMQVLPHLRSIDISGSEVTGVGVKAVASGRCMEEMNIERCRFVSFDAVDWARARGLRVRFSNGDKPAGGQKLRY